MKLKTPVVSAVLFLFIFVPATLLCGAAGRDAIDTGKLVGAWQLTGIRVEGEKEFQPVPKTLHRIKLVTPTHFTWVQYNPDTKIVEWAAGGRCEQGDARYVEHIEYAVGPAGLTQLIGHTQTFTFRVEGDKWYHAGTLTTGNKIEEMWERVKAPAPSAAAPQKPK
jgi:hypothetical protein